MFLKQISSVLFRSEIERGSFFDGEIARNRVAGPLTLEPSEKFQYGVGAENVEVE